MAKAHPGPCGVRRCMGTALMYGCIPPHPADKGVCPLCGPILPRHSASGSLCGSRPKGTPKDQKSWQGPILGHVGSASARAQHFHWLHRGLGVSVLRKVPIVMQGYPNGP